MSTPNDAKLPLRLAFSHREKADAAIRQCDRAYSQKSIDAQHHAKQRALFERERASAQRKIDRLLGIAQARVESIEAQRRVVLEEQLHLSERVVAGKLSAVEANDSNRRLTVKLAEFDAELETARELAEAKSAEELGGFIDLPITDYVSAEIARPDVRLRKPPEPIRRDWYIAFGLAVVAGASVFLPWMSQAGVSSSLAAGGNNLSRLFATSDLPEGLARYAWIVLGVLPFLGVIGAAGKRARAVGWFFLILGLVMLAAGTFPGLMLGARGGSAVTLLQLIESFRVGAVLYSLAGLGFILLGAQRVSPPGDSLRHAISVSLALLGAMAGVGLLAALALLGVQGQAEISFSAALDESTRDRIAFTIRNNGREPIACFFPLPSEGVMDSSPVRRNRTFGLLLWIREGNAEEFRPAPPAPFVWRLAQGPIPEDQAVTIGAGAGLTGYLDVRQLSVLGVEAGATRIDLVRSDGTSLEQVEVALSDTYLSTPATVRDPILVPTPPARPVLQAPGQPSPTADAPTGPTPEAVTTTAPVIQVEYTGSISGKAVLRIYDAVGNVVDDVVVGPNEQFYDGWRVVAVERQPAAVRVQRENQTVTVPRGQPVELR